LLWTGLSIWKVASQAPAAKDANDAKVGSSQGASDK